MPRKTSTDDILAEAARRGPSGQRGVVRQRIIDAARQSFAEQGRDGTSLRAVAREAGADSRAVGYYFADKSALLAACIEAPAGFLEGVALIVQTPLSRRGSAMVGFQLRAWAEPQGKDILRAVMLIAAHHPLALERLQAVYRTSLIGAVADSLDDDERLVRAGLVASQMIGLAMARFVWRLEPIASLPHDAIVALVGPTLQRYLSGRLPPFGSSGFSH